MAAAGAAAALPEAAEGAEFFMGYPDSYGVLHDTTLCIGCRRCEKACSEVNDLPEPDRPFDDLSVLDEKRRTSDDSYTIVNRYQVSGYDKSPVFRKFQCNHCAEPACASACFVGAFTKTPEGAVIYDKNLCVGCRYCMIACPFDVPTFEYDKVLTPRIMKCTMCHPRVVEGKLPGCVAACPQEALVFAKRKHLVSIARERMRKYPERYVDHIYGEYEVGGTNWIYITGAPFEALDFHTNLGTKPAPKLTSGALSMVPIVVGVWPALLGGIYLISQRRQAEAAREKAGAVEEAERRTQAAADEAMKKAAEKAKQDKEKSVEMAVKKALEEAEKKKGEE